MTSGADGGCSIRPARDGDLAAIVAIYNHYVTTSHSTFDLDPVSVDQRRAWLAQFAAAGRYRLLVARDADRVTGYAHSLPFRPKPAYQTSVETTVYIAPGCTGAGIGTALYRTLFEALAGEDLHRAYAIIAQPNDASNRLHAAFGFREVARLREVGRKFGRYWDVAWFERALD